MISVCLTGDYRGRTHGDCRPCLEAVARLREALTGDVHAVLGNHDSITMVPDLEALGIRVLLNECVVIERDGASIYLAGVDDAHFFRADNIEKAAAEIPQGCISVLLSHTPEIYRQAAHAGFESDAERTHAWRADLLARRRSHPARSRSAPRFRGRRMATCGNGRLYLGGDGVLGRAGAIQQSTGDNPASAGVRRASVGPVSKADGEKEPRRRQRSDREQHDDREDVDRIKREIGRAGDCGKQGLRNLIET